MKVIDIMTAKPLCVLANDPIQIAARSMRARDVGMMPVVDDLKTMHLVGVITDRDIAIRCVAEGHSGTCAVREHMTTPPLHTVQPTEDVVAVARVMKSGKVRRLPVIDAAGKLVGVVAQADLVTNARLRDLHLIETTLASISAPAIPA